MAQFPVSLVVLAILAASTQANIWPEFQRPQKDPRIPENPVALQNMCASYAAYRTSTKEHTVLFDTHYTINMEKAYHNASEETENGALYSPTPEVEDSNSVERCRKCTVDITGSIMKVKDTLRFDSSTVPRNDHCNVSVREVEELLDTFNERKGKPLGQTVQEEVQDECQKSLQSLKESRNRLIALVPIEDEGITPVQYHEERLRHEEEMKQMQKNMDFIKQQAHPDAQEKVNQVQMKVQELQSSMMDRKIKMEAKLSQDEHHLLEAVAMAIKSGEIGKAQRLFQMVENKKKLSVVVKRTYNADNVDNMIVFAEGLSEVMNKARLVSRLIDELLADVRGPKVLLADSYIRTLITTINRIPSVFHVEHVRQALKLLKDARDKLQVRVAEVIEDLAKELIGTERGPLAEFARERNGIFNNYFGAIIAKAWTIAVERNQTESAASNIVEFFEQLHSDGQPLPKIEVFADKFFSEMFKSDKVPLAPSLKLVYNIKKQVGNVMSAKDNSALKFLKHIVYGMPFVLENEETKGQLIISDPFSVERNNVVANTQGRFFRWHFETDDGKTFTIRATDTTPVEWLYAGMDYLAHNATQRRVFTWRFGGDSDEQGHWELRDADWRSQKMYLWNKYNGEYLNAEESTKVYTLRNSDGKGHAPVWNFITMKPLHI